MASGKAVVIRSSGGTDVLEVVPDFAVAAPAAGEVLVRLAATSVNPVDVYVRSGMYPSPEFPKARRQRSATRGAARAARAARLRKLCGANEGLRCARHVLTRCAAPRRAWAATAPHR